MIRKNRQVQALMNEINILRDIDHPNVIKLHKVYETSSHIHLVLDYLEGGDLLDKIEKNGPMLEKKSIKLIRKVLEVVNYLSSKGIVHRDIKLENILMVSQT